MFEKKKQTTRKHSRCTAPLADSNSLLRQIRPITCNTLYVRVEEQFINVIIYIKLLAYYYYYYYYRIDLF